MEARIGREDMFDRLCVKFGFRRAGDTIKDGNGCAIYVGANSG